MKTIARNPHPLFAWKPRPAPDIIARKAVVWITGLPRMERELRVTVLSGENAALALGDLYGPIEVIAEVGPMLGTRRALLNAGWRAACEAVASGTIAPDTLPAYGHDDLDAAVAARAVPGDVYSKVCAARDRALFGTDESLDALLCERGTIYCGGCNACIALDNAPAGNATEAR